MRGLTSLLVASVLILCVIVPRLAREPLPPTPPKPPPADPQLWTFDRRVEQPESFEIAWARGRVQEDPVRRRLRQAVLDASSRLEFSPCDSQLRPPLRRAIGALLLELRDTAGQKLEIARMDGEEFDATPFLNTAAAAVIREARHVGLVYREDLPPEVGILFPARPSYPDSGRYGGRFACVDGGR
jgi:hypothetical protein